MLNYKTHLKPYARSLRKNQTLPESILWFYIRKKQVCGLLFCRQKPIGPYIVDFYSHASKLVIELDGGQHYTEHQQQEDEKRDLFLRSKGLKVLRFNNLEVLSNVSMVLNVIISTITNAPIEYQYGNFIVKSEVNN